MWRTVKLCDICTLRNGRAYKKDELLDKGKFPVLRVGNFFTNEHWYYSDLELDDYKYCDKGDLLYAWSASFGPQIWTGGKVVFHYHIWRVDVKEKEVDKKFLFYWFEYDKERIKREHGTGTTMVHVTKGAMEQRKLSLPPLAEQQRIVEKLDRAFAEIDKNLNIIDQSIDQITSFLAISIPYSLSTYATETYKSKISELFKVSSGNFLPAKKMNISGEFDVYGGNGIIGKHNDFNLSKETIVIGRVGAKCGNVHYVDNKIWLTDNAMYIHSFTKKVSLRLLASVLQVVKLGSYARQSAQPVISFSSIKDVVLELPVDIAEQEIIANKIERLKGQVENFLEIRLAVKRRFLSLKSSILKQALQPPQQ